MSNSDEPSRQTGQPIEVLATEHEIKGTLVAYAELSDEDRRTVRITLCDDGEKLEVAATYLGIGTRVAYQGDDVAVSVRVYNDLVKGVAAASFAGDEQRLDADVVAAAILESRAKR